MEARHNSLNDVLRVHNFLFCLACLLLGYFGQSFAVSGPLGLNLELVVCIFFVSIFGLAHGSLDYVRLERMESNQPGQRLGKITIDYNVVPFYLLLAGIYYLLWQIFPLFALVGFILFSVVHFAGQETFWLRPLARLRSFTSIELIKLSVAGSPILLPCGYKSQEIRPILQALLGDGQCAGICDSDCAVFAFMLLSVVWLALVIFSIYRILGLDSGRKGECEDKSRIFQEVILLASLSFLVLKVSPLAVFTLYFCGYHAIQESLIWIWNLSDGKSVKSGFCQFVFLAIPPVLMVIFSAMLFVMQDKSIQPDNLLARTLFLTLSCISFPHFLVRCFRNNGGIFVERKPKIYATELNRIN